MKSVLPAFAMLAVVAAATVAGAAENPDADGRAGGRFLRTYCYTCHDQRQAKGDVRLDRLAPSVDAQNVELWKDVVHNLQRGDMPPEDQRQPPADQRQAFLQQAIGLLDRFAADTSTADDPLMRLTNKQIAHSIQDLLSVSRDISTNLVEDPVDQHGYSRQAELDISGGYFDLYLPQLHEAVSDAIPNLAERPEVFRIAGDDWEKQHYLSTWSLSERSRRNLYRGPQWLGEKFEIPLPPRHEYRMYLKDNRPEGEFRIRLTLRNQPPTEDGEAISQQVAVYLDEGFMRPYRLVKTITVPAIKGSQRFDLFGNVRDWVGISSEPFETTPAAKPIERSRIKSYRVLSVQNNNTLAGFPPPVKLGEADRSGDVFLVRPDDQWIAAFGSLPGLYPSYGGPAGAHPGGKGKTKPVYREAMKTHGHVFIERIEFELPFHASWPPPSAQPFLTDGRLQRDDMPRKLQAFAARAWRRPLTTEMAGYIEQIVAEEFAAGASDSDALRNALVVILSDPKFLYLSRTGRTVRERNFELVSRLAYFLWDGPPDQRLLTLAARDQAIGDKAILSEADRLLADPRAGRFVEAFASLWVGFKQFDQIAIDPNYYPQWRPSLKPHLKYECVALFSELLQHDLSCLNLLDSDFIMANQRLGEHYGVAGGVSGMNFSRVPAPPGRGGVLTQAAVLLAYSNGQDAHAVSRGVWVRSRLLGDPPSDPPPDVPALADQDVAEVDNLSIKQRLEIHRVGTCYDCHKDIDPWGIAMEGFDATGLARTSILRIATEKGGRRKLPLVQDVQIDGQSVDGMAELKKHLRAHRGDDFAYAFTRHLLSYAIGRPVSYRDEQEVVRLQAKFQADDHRMRSLIKAIVTSPLFVDHRPAATEN